MNGVRKNPWGTRSARACPALQEAPAPHLKEKKVRGWGQPRCAFKGSSPAVLSFHSVPNGAGADWRFAGGLRLP